MSTFWSIWVTVIVLGTVFGCWWLLWATRKGQTTDTETDRTMGHAFDGIEEYDNPLPKWWFYLFIATCVFALGYLRSEEHTSELQSRPHLVCRLLLEKK